MCNLNYRVGRDSLFRICINIFFGRNIKLVLLKITFLNQKGSKKEQGNLLSTLRKKGLQGQNTETNLFVTYIRSLHRKVADINWIS